MVTICRVKEPPSANLLRSVRLAMRLLWGELEIELPKPTGAQSSARRITDGRVDAAQHYHMAPTAIERSQNTATERRTPQAEP